MRTSRIHLTLASFLLVVLAWSAARGAAAEFTADVTAVRGKSVMEGRLYVSGNKYRLDFITAGREIFLTVDGDTDSVVVLDPEAKQYFTRPANAPGILKVDPFQAVQYAGDMHLRQYIGTDSIGSWACDEFRVRDQETIMYTEFIAHDLGFPVLIIDHLAKDTAYTRVDNIAVTRITPEVFAIPEGYERRGEETVQEEESGTVKAGDEVRLPLDANRYAEVTLINVADKASEAVVSLFKEGAELPQAVVGSVESRTFTLTSTGEQIRRIWNVQADEVLIRVTAGELAVDVLQP